MERCGVIPPVNHRRAGVSDACGRIRFRSTAPHHDLLQAPRHLGVRRGIVRIDLERFRQQTHSDFGVLGHG